NAAVVCPEYPTQRFDAEPGAAAFIRDREAPAANAIVAALQLRPGDGAGPDHDHTAVPAAMPAATGRLRVRDDDGLAKRMRVALRGGEVGGFARARQRQARDHPSQVARRQASLAQALHGGVKNGPEGRITSKANVRGPGGGFSELFP